MKKSKKIFITAALTGAVHVPSMSPYLPITPQQLVDEGVRAREAGAAVVHIHTRNPETGEPDASLELMGEVLEGIQKRCDVICCVTTGASQLMSLEERLAPHSGLSAGAGLLQRRFGELCPGRHRQEDPRRLRLGEALSDAHPGQRVFQQL